LPEALVHVPASDLSQVFKPKSVALIGASDAPDSLGTVVLENLKQAGFAGPVFLVNPRHARIGGEMVYASALHLPSPVDLAIVVAPAAAVPQIVTECGERGIRGAIIMSAGFREAGPAGVACEREVLERARRFDLRFVGPNCLGVIRTDINFNGTFSAANALRGSIGLISQSGALCSAILDWARVNEVGFSSVISTGIGADLDFGEMLDFLALDPQTQSIMLYVEGIHGARRFMSALRAAARIKPVVVMKAGRHAAGSRAALSHSGALVGADDVFDAVLRRAGVLRIRDFTDFFGTAATLGFDLRTAGRRLAVITNAGGPGVMAADHAIDRGITLATFSAATTAKLDARLPPTSSKANPVDVLGDASPARYVAALRACLEDANVDAVIAILAPQALTSAEAVARALLPLHVGGKPLLTCWMGESSVASSRALFLEHGIPTFRTPEAAVDALAAISAWGENQQQLLQVPEPLTRQAAPDVDGARSIIETALAEGRSVLSLPESKAVLAAFDIPILASLPAHSVAEAVTVAEEIGYPVAMKILSPDITHKTDVGGVRLGIADARELRREFQDLMASVNRLQPDAHVDGVTIEPMWRGRRGRELLIGATRDEVFGPAVGFGLGGTMVEIIADRAVALPPLNRYLAADLVARTRAAKYLAPFRGAPAANRGAVEDVLVRVSEMVCELPWLAELDLNPVMADERGVVVIDARLVVRPWSPSARQYDHMAIYPYPSKLVRSFDLPNGVTAMLRPIRPEDAVIEREFVNGLSAHSRYLRFMYALQEISPAMVSRFTQIDYDREMAFVAVVDGAAGEQEIGVARYTTLADGESCEFALVVADQWQGKGLGRQLIAALIEVARERRLKEMRGIALAENARMLAFARAAGFEVSTHPDDPNLKALRLAL
jgi:acetyltransferase